jgi:hypothetical protein
MNSRDLLDAGWQDITGSFEERDRYLELARQGKAVVRRLHDGWFGKLIDPKTAPKKIFENRMPRP